MTTPHLPVLSPLMVEDQVRAALAEDLGRAGDITSQATIAPAMTARAELNAREEGVVAGLDLARAAFRLMDPDIRFEAFVADERSLADHLSDQLGLAADDAATRLIGQAIVNEIDETGYFRGDVQAIADRLGAPPEDVERVLALVQAFVDHVARGMAATAQPESVSA